MRTVRWMAMGLLIMAWPAVAQLRYGDLSTRLNGTISSGYSATYGNLTSSTHGWAFGGVGTLSGSYYDPNFLSYTASFYLNQSRANSNFQSISNASGMNFSTNIFSGSHFPGSINYSKDYNSQGNYSVPGLSDFVTHGNSDNFGINWSERLPGAPSFSAGYQRGSGNYTVYGSDSNGSNKHQSLHLHSGYTLAGFNMGAYYTKGSSKSKIPHIVSNLPFSEVQSGSSGEGFNISHQLPLNGSFSTSYNRSQWDTNYLGNVVNGTINILNSMVAIHPVEKLAFSVSANYSDNLSGQIWQQVLAGGAASSATPVVTSDQTSNSLDIRTLVGYSPGVHLHTSAYFERRTQEFLGKTYGVKTYGGDVIYLRPLLEGTFSGSLSVAANHSDTSGADTLGFSANTNYSRRVLGWKVNTMFGYAQNVQTLLVTYMNSYYHYSANVQRRWGWFHMGLGAGGSRTGLTQKAGTENSSQSYTASFGYNRYITANGNYSRSDGQALATGAGLVNVPIPPPTLPSDLYVLFGGESYSFGLSSSPAKRLILTASYGQSKSNTFSNSIATTSRNNQFTSLTQYRFRKMSFTSGYARLEQGFGSTNSEPQIISSYFVGISRWFNFF